VEAVDRVMDESDRTPGFFGPFTFNYTDSETGEKHTVAIDGATFFEVGHIAKRWGIDHAVELLTIGASVVKWQPLSEDDRRRLRQLVTQAAERSWDSIDEMALRMTYRRLWNKEINYQQAADQASDLLGRKIDRDTWRRRIERWAERRSLPKIEVYKPRQE
jgi:hypothetical protein